MKNDLFFLKNIQVCIAKILKYTTNISYEDFLKDEKTIDAVERNLEIIGESVKKLSEELKQNYPQIPFRQIAGMRDKLIHDYFGTDYGIIWTTVKTKIPEFQIEINKVIESVDKIL